MKVRIVCYEDVDTWILGKFAKKMQTELTLLGVDVDIAKTADPKADINHHIIYLDYKVQQGTPKDTLMITHINALQKLTMLKKQLEVARLGICMSLETMQNLIESGIPKERLYFINPAHDAIIKPRPLVLGITSATYEDGRKKEDILIDLCAKLSPNDFMFKIMGRGWQKIVDTLQAKGFRVEYYSQFDYDTYVNLVPTFDYYLYFGWDEGSMGFVDALAAGAQTIVTPQGFHLDAPSGVSYPVKNFQEAAAALQKIGAERRSRIDLVKDWTWKRYAEEHLKVWTAMLANESLTPLLTEKIAEVRPAGSTRKKASKLATQSSYLTKSLTYKTWLWNISPSFVKVAYKKAQKNKG